MEKIIKIKIGLGIVMVGLIAFTTSFIMKQIRLLVNTEFTMAGTEVNKISLTEIKLTLWWKVVNKSDISITLSNQKYDIFLGGEFVKQVGSDIPIEIKAKADTRIPTYISFSPQEIIKVGGTNMASFLTKEGRKKLMLDVKGTMTVKTSIFTVKDFPIEYSDSIESMMS